MLWLDSPPPFCLFVCRVELLCDMRRHSTRRVPLPTLKKSNVCALLITIIIIIMDSLIHWLPTSIRACINRDFYRHFLFLCIYTSKWYVFRRKNAMKRGEISKIQKKTTTKIIKFHVYTTIFIISCKSSIFVTRVLIRNLLSCKT